MEAGSFRACMGRLKNIDITALASDFFEVAHFFSAEAGGGVAFTALRRAPEFLDAALFSREFGARWRSSLATREAFAMPTISRSSQERLFCALTGWLALSTMNRLSGVSVCVISRTCSIWLR